MSIILRKRFQEKIQENHYFPCNLRQNKVFPRFFPGVFPQIAGSYRGSNFSKGGIVLANWPTSGCCSECCAGCCQGPRVLLRVLSRVLRIMFAIGRCQGAVQGAVQGCCPGCSGSCLALGSVRVLSRVSGSCLPLGGVRMLSRAVQGAVRVLRIMFAIGRCCPGCSAEVLFRVLRIMFAIGRCQGAV